MNQTMEMILSRRSIRKFQDRPIPEEDIRQIVDAALHAPSAMGRQTWKFTVVMNREKIRELARATGEVLGREGYDMYCPQVLIIPSNLETSPFGREDNACALENMFLAAHSLGIGSVWINQLQGICHEPRIRSILKKLQIPDDHVVYGMAALGYAAEEPAPKERIGQTAYIR